MVATLLTLPLRLGIRVATATVEETVVLGARALGVLAELIAPRQSPSTAPDESAPADVSGTADVSVPPDVSSAGDVVAPPDVSAAGDVVAPPDVSAAGDVVAPPDVSSAGDVVVPPDVSGARAEARAPAPLADEAPVPVPPPEPAHVSEDPELVREDADPGAEDGAGAQLRIAEPWDGYHLMNARDVIDRLASASPEELAAVELYERSHRRRKTVVSAAERALKLASPPGRQAAQPPPA